MLTYWLLRIPTGLSHAVQRRLGVYEGVHGFLDMAICCDLRP